MNPLHPRLSDIIRATCETLEISEVRLRVIKKGDVTAGRGRQLLAYVALRSGYSPQDISSATGRPSAHIKASSIAIEARLEETHIDNPFERAVKAIRRRAAYLQHMDGQPEAEFCRPEVVLFKITDPRRDGSPEYDSPTYRRWVERQHDAFTHAMLRAGYVEKDEWVKRNLYAGALA